MVTGLELFKESMKLMGNHFEISVVHNDATWANASFKLCCQFVKAVLLKNNTSKANKHFMLITDVR